MEERNKIKDLDLILDRLDREEGDTVPLLVKGNNDSNFIPENDEELRWFKYLQGELVKLDLCRIKPTQSVKRLPYDYKELELLHLGRELLVNRLSVKSVYDEQRKKKCRENFKTNTDIGKNLVTIILAVIYALADVVANLAIGKGVFDIVKSWIS